MKNKKQITVIIPVYNCKNYLAECFDSIINQTIGLDKLDVVIIDDGSTDGSDEVIKKYKKQYPDWKVITQNNAGISKVREIGIEKVNTKYTCFLDSDDYMAKTALADLLESAERNSSDVVIGGMENFTFTSCYPNYTTKYLKNFNSISCKEYPHLIDFAHVHGKLYRTEIIKNKHFIAGTKHEDNYLTLSVYLSTDKITLLNKILYHKRDREGNNKSIMQSLGYETFKDLLANYGKALDENEYDKKTIQLIMRKINHYIVKEVAINDWLKASKLANEFREKYKQIDKIDFVVTWVDGSDSKWLKEKIKYEKQAGFMNDNRAIRYRDFNLLKYWFRAVETNAPWVHKIYFVTWGHVPKWLNTDNEKLVIVKHSDFIPKQYLPTFNSCAIEMNLHRIKGLSENFVYFNDDMYIMNKTKKGDFFKNGLPRDAAIADIIVPSGKDMFQHRLVNNSTIINKYYNFRDAVKNNPLKWLNPKYGKYQINTIFLLSKKKLSTIRPSHLPASLTKKSFVELWEKEGRTLDQTSREKFRSITNVNPWVIQGLQMASGCFSPRNPKIGKYTSINDNLNSMQAIIKKCNCKLFCLNDSVELNDFNAVKKCLINSFEQKFPTKSSYER